MNFAWAAGIAAFTCACAAQAQSQPQPISQPQSQARAPAKADRAIRWSLGVAPVHRRLTENTASGERLLVERGGLGRFDARAQPLAWDGRLDLRAALTAGRLDYSGQTQSGVPLFTTTRHGEAELGARWRTFESASWGAFYVGADWLRFRRLVEPAPGSSLLRETSSLVMPAVEWRSASFGLGGFEFQADATLRSSYDHRLRVGFNGLFDDTTIHGGRRNEAMLELSTEVAPDWQLGLSWSHARQKPSDEVMLLRGGVLAGTVKQPELRIDDVSLRLSRSF